MIRPKKLLFYDTETTGLTRWDLPADAPEQPRIVQLAAVLCDGDGQELEWFEHIVRPEGWTVHPKAAEVHGITTEIAIERGIPIAQALDHFDGLSKNADMLAAFHLRFDEKLMRGERRRAGRPDGFGSIPVFCCMKGVIEICQIPATTAMKKTGRGNKWKTPNLGQAVQMVLEREHAGAHSALSDARAAKEIYFKLRDNLTFIEEGSKFQSNEEGKP